MGYKVYGEDRTPTARWKEFIEWLVVTCLWFPTTIGSWLDFFGLSLGWLSVLTILVAIATAHRFSKS